MSQHLFPLPQTVPTHHKQRTVNVELHAKTEVLHQALAREGLVQRMKYIPQLGPIRVKAKDSLTRYHYMFLQLYLHQLVRESDIKLKYRYGSRLKRKDCPPEYADIATDSPTIAEAIQMMVILCNIGHYTKTFTASRAMILCMHKNPHLQKQFLAQFIHPQIQNAATEMIKYYRYDKWHLLNTYLLLQNIQLDEALRKLSICLLQAYLAPSSLPKNSRLEYVVELFDVVRGLASVAYDLKSTQMSLAIDLYNTVEVTKLLNELLSKYNNTTQPRAIITSAQKLLSDTVYNNPKKALQYYAMSQKICANINQMQPNINFQRLFHHPESPVNISYPMTTDFNSQNILKLTFEEHEFKVFEKLLQKLAHTSQIRVGYYTRPASAAYTLLLAMKKNVKQPHIVAGRVVRIIASVMNTKSLQDSERPIENKDGRYLLVAKFFLENVFPSCRIDINPTVSLDCVFYIRGNKAKDSLLDNILQQNIGTVDQAHEVKFMQDVLRLDQICDTSILIPSSIVINNTDNEPIKEFDGLMIHPTRQTIVFLEAKNTKDSGHAVEQLRDKLKTFSIAPNANIQKYYHDAYVEIPISQL